MVSQQLRETDSPSVRLLGLGELSEHAQTVTDANERVALTVNVVFPFVRFARTAIEIERLSKTALLAGTLALAKEIGR